MSNSCGCQIKKAADSFHWSLKSTQEFNLKKFRFNANIINFVVGLTMKEILSKLSKSYICLCSKSLLCHALMSIYEWWKIG